MGFSELEEEGQEGTEQYMKATRQLVNVYTFLQDVEKTLFYARKLKGVYKFYAGRELDDLSEEVIRESSCWMMGDLHSMGVPVSVSFPPIA